MKGLKIIALVVLLLFAGGLMGCGGGGAQVKTTTTTVTLGQQLLDLHDAFQKGAIDEKQYKSSKKDLLNKYK
jgi:hypothetical protein